MVLPPYLTLEQFLCFNLEKEVRKNKRLMLQGAWLALEAQQVIALRLTKLAMGGSAAMREAHRMMTEKVDATTKATGMITGAMARGSPDCGSDLVVRMLRKRVRANRRRLIGGG